MGGHAFDSWLDMIYLIKVDNEGIKEWGYQYDPNYLPLTDLEGLVAVDDGYVLAAYSETLETNWLVKLNNQGIFTSTGDVLENLLKQNFTLFPNPVHHSVNIQFENPFSGTIGIFGLDGRQMFQTKLHYKLLFSHAIHDFPSGMYTVRVIDEKNHQVQSTIFIKH